MFYGYVMSFFLSDKFSCLEVALREINTMILHSSTLAWEIPWTEEPRRLQSMGSLKVGHD